MKKKALRPKYASPKPNKPRSLRPAERSRPPGKIITFYSYKGGTGRSMALANVAWILASAGQRVLIIDWDLEAPGLHRYFRPFLKDEELLSTRGLIDFFNDFVEASRLHARHDLATSPDGTPWFYDYADLTRYAVSLKHPNDDPWNEKAPNLFPDMGTIDFVCAGRQGSAYAIKINSFQWTELFEKLGGGVLIEAMKQRLREEYDYILIDSRTGLSDTSGICTVQMPDELVVCFTLNRQSILGAAAAARSADSQRRTPSGQRGLRIWPVPMRVESGEKHRLDAARTLIQEQFSPLLWHISRSHRSDYWGGIEVQYFPYYAFEEVLATVADSPGLSLSLLNSLERLTNHLTSGAITQIRRISETDRNALRDLFTGVNTPDQSVRKSEGLRVYISYAHADIQPRLIKELAKSMEMEFRARLPSPVTVFWDALVPLGVAWESALLTELARSQVVLMLFGLNWKQSSFVQRELQFANEHNLRLIPVLLDGMSWQDMPDELRLIHGMHLSTKAVDFRKGKIELAERVAASLSTAFEPIAATDIDPNDPQKGRWGGESKRNGRQLQAVVESFGKDWFSVRLTAKGSRANPLKGEVVFHLHPTFDEQIIRVPVHSGSAVLELAAYGAFTVGAQLDEGQTILELDLAQVSNAPQKFKER